MKFSLGLQFNIRVTNGFRWVGTAGRIGLFGPVGFSEDEESSK